MRKEKTILGGILALAVLSIAATTGCSGTAPGTVKSYMQELTSEARGAGLSGEQDQISKLKNKFMDWGYDVSFDEFKAQTRLGEDFSSKNIIAKKKADKDAKNPDILIVSAHIDSIASTTGAIDNASGVAAIEDIACKTKNLPSDTEIWYVIFSGEEEGILGSTHFVKSISDDDKSRIIGDIQIDMLGQYLTDGFDIDTTTGNPNLLSDLLVQSTIDTTGNTVKVTQEKSSDHVSFSVAGIPSVMLTQHGDGYENHEIIDNIDQVDMTKLQQGTDIVKSVVKQIMSDETTGLAALQQEVQSEDAFAGYLNSYDEIIDLDTSLQGMKNTLGTDMTLINELTDDTLGQVDTYQADIYWLGLDKALTTNLTFYNEDFQYGEILAYDANINLETMKETLTNLIGYPEIKTAEDGSTQYFWGWLLGRTGYDLDCKSNGSYTLTVSPYSIGNEKTSSIELDKTGNPTDVLDGSAKKVWDDIISKIIPEKWRASYIDQFVLFTDGVRYVSAFTDPAEPDNINNTMWIDQNDLFDQNGEYRHFYKSAATIIHEFGHVIAMNQDQVDVTAVEDSYTLPPYNEDSYMAAFMKEFYPDQDINDMLANENHTFREHPDEYVSLYANDKTMEDFAESFKCFVLMDHQLGNTIAEQKINFFYQYPEMVHIRDSIRSNFDWLS